MTRTTRSGRRRAFAPILVALVAATFLSAAPAQSGLAPGAPEVDAFAAAGWDDVRAVDYKPREFSGSMFWITRRVTGAAAFWEDGHTGKGVDVALIDTGVTPVTGLTTPGKLLNGPDLSFDGPAKDRQFVDGFGHGTHIAGIIAGADLDLKVSDTNERQFLGMAPGARLVNVKVGDRNGIVDVSQVVAAIHWVVDHRKDNGLNIRVINLSYGTDGVQRYEVDPLAAAVERAWQAGIVVVVAAGNDGNGAALRNPAYDPFVIAVGAARGNETADARDDTVAGFSNCGRSSRHVDIVAPGKSIVSLKAPGSVAEKQSPQARINKRYLAGSGSSQAAGVVSGAAALIIDQRPGIGPDQVKALLMGTAQPLSNAKGLCQGAGHLDLGAARKTDTPKAHQDHSRSDGSGSIEGARGTIHVTHGGVVLEGEIDIFGNPWKGASWSGGSWGGASWSGGSWSGMSWSGASWSGASWSGGSWSGGSWSGASWSGGSWSAGAWQGLSWRGPSAML